MYTIHITSFNHTILFLNIQLLLGQEYDNIFLTNNLLITMLDVTVSIRIPTKEVNSTVTTNITVKAFQSTPLREGRLRDLFL